MRYTPARAKARAWPGGIVKGQIFLQQTVEGAIARLHLCEAVSVEALLSRNQVVHTTHTHHATRAEERKKNTDAGLVGAARLLHPAVHWMGGIWNLEFKLGGFKTYALGGAPGGRHFVLKAGFLFRRQAFS